MVEAVLLRTIRSTQRWELILRQGDEICANASLVFALRRPTWSVQEAMPPHRVRLVESPPRASDIDYPPFTRCYDMH